MGRGALDIDPKDPMAIHKASRSKTPARHPFTGKRLKNGKKGTGKDAIKAMQQRWRAGRATRDVSDFAGVQKNPNARADYAKEGRELVKRLGDKRVPKGLEFKDPKSGEVLKGGRRLPEGFKVQATRSGQVRVVRNGSVPVKVLRAAFRGDKGRFQDAKPVTVRDQVAFERALRREADSFVPGGEASSKQLEIFRQAALDELLDA